MNSFRSYVWDPLLLIGQIICIQAVFYTAQCAFMMVGSTLGYEASLAGLMSLQTTRWQAIVQLLSCLVCAVAISIVIQRAKQCLDFACTYHFFHMIIAIAYNMAIPTRISWYALQVLSIAVCTVVGEYLCMRVESQEIRIGAPSKYDL